MSPWHDLTQPFYEDMPHSDVHPEPTMNPASTIDADAVNVTEFTAVTHVGTHIDAPVHVVPDGTPIDELPIESFVGDGVVVDVSRADPTEITVDEFEAASGEVRPGDILLLYTGWCHRYGDDDYSPHPWLSTDLADRLVDIGVTFVAIDTITPDLPGPYREPDWTDFPVHRILLGEDVLIAEHVGGLAPLAGERLEVFAFPLKIRGGDGAQARILART